jgi:glycosylphosphatidylinositol transamidase (GPIT) subunit GPI8
MIYELSNNLVYMISQGGDGFLNFRDAKGIRAFDHDDFVKTPVLYCNNRASILVFSPIKLGH